MLLHRMYLPPPGFSEAADALDEAASFLHAGWGRAGVCVCETVRGVGQGWAFKWRTASLSRNERHLKWSFWLA